MDMSRIRTKKTVGERLKELRLQKNITQQEAADALNISRSALGRFENDLQELSGDLVVRFADYYGISCDTLYAVWKISIIKSTKLQDWMQNLLNG